MKTLNLDPKEVAKFSNLATRWWDKQGEFKPLHDINPLRLQFIQKHINLKDKTVLDIGCGGGILTESLAAQGAQVTGIDASSEVINAAQIHLKSNPLAINYLQITAEEYAHQAPETFEVVTCMELLEHVPDPASLVKAAAKLVRPGGEIFFSTLNRTLKSYLLAIVGAEYVLNWLPKGTHDYAKFIRPSELANYLRGANLTLQELAGLSYNPLRRNYHLSTDIDVNYLAYCIRQ